MANATDLQNLLAARSALLASMSSGKPAVLGFEVRGKRVKYESATKKRWTDNSNTPMCCLASTLRDKKLLRPGGGPRGGVTEWEKWAGKKTRLVSRICGSFLAQGGVPVDDTGLFRSFHTI